MFVLVLTLDPHLSFLFSLTSVLLEIAFPRQDFRQAVLAILPSMVRGVGFGFYSSAIDRHAYGGMHWYTAAADQYGDGVVLGREDVDNLEERAVK